MQSKATAVWTGGLKDGKGLLSTQSEALKETPYSFHSRFEGGEETNPEELLAAAHAGCFAMALSNELTSVGLTPKRLEATATISLEKNSTGFVITKSHIDLIADIPDAETEKFDVAVNQAKTNCPVSKLFRAEISVATRLNK